MLVHDMMLGYEPLAASVVLIYCGCSCVGLFYQKKHSTRLD